MLILDATTETIEVVLGGAVATSELEINANYVDVTTTLYTPGSSATVTTGGTAVTAVAAPGASTQRQVKFLSVFNADTASATVTVKHDNSGTERRYVSVTIAPSETLQYTDGEGWRVVPATGTATYGPNLAYWANLVGNGTTFSTLNTTMTTPIFFPMNPTDQFCLFPGQITATALYLGVSGSQTATTASSTSGNFSVRLGIYTRNGNNLSLLNSGSMSFSIGSGSDCTSGLHGPRFLSFHSSAFSASLTFSRGEYYMGLIFSTVNTSKSIAWFGQRYDATNQHSGFMGTSTATATSHGRFPFCGLYSAGSAALPTNVANSQINKANANAGFIPYVALVSNNILLT